MLNESSADLKHIFIGDLLAEEEVQKQDIIKVKIVG